MIRKPLLRFLSLFLAALIVCPWTVRADFEILDAIQEFGEKRYVKTGPARLHAGPVRVHPTLSSKAAYDSNILLEPKDAREDVVFNVRPGAIVELPIQQHQLAAGYQADFEMFSKDRHSRQKDQNQNFFALADLNFPNWYINVLEKFAETSSRAGTTFTDRIPRYDQSIHPKIGYQWKRATFEGGFRHFMRDFRRHAENKFDFQVKEYTGVFYYDLFARLKTLLEYQLGQIDYHADHTRSGLYHQVRVGLIGELTPNWTMQVRVGPQFRNYRYDSEHDFNSIVWDFLTEYKIKSNLKLHAGVSREPVEATFQAVNFYTQYLARVGYDYEIRPRWTLFTDLKYYRHNYSEQAVVLDRAGYRRDNLMGLETGLRYAMRDWLTWKLEYDYLRRDSNFSTLDYTDHQVSLSSNIAY